jgi:hypothetical protein
VRSLLAPAPVINNSYLFIINKIIHESESEREGRGGRREEGGGDTFGSLGTKRLTQTEITMFCENEQCLKGRS